MAHNIDVQKSVSFFIPEEVFTTVDLSSNSHIKKSKTELDLDAT